MVHSNETGGEQSSLRAFEADLVQGNVQAPIILTTAARSSWPA